MAIPQLSPEDRQAALEKAKAARIKRAQVRDDLKAGKLTLAQVVDMKDDPVIGRMKVSTLIETLPGYGKAKAEKVMKELQLAESRPRSLTGHAVVHVRFNTFAASILHPAAPVVNTLDGEEKL